MKHFKKSKGNTLFVFMTVLFIAVSLFTACGSDRKPKNVQKFTITYESEFAEAPHPVSLTKDTALTAEQLPELFYAGYEFLGWYVTGGTEEAPEETKIEAGFALTQNITLKAK